MSPNGQHVVEEHETNAPFNCALYIHTCKIDRLPLPEQNPVEQRDDEHHELEEEGPGGQNAP